MPEKKPPPDTDAEKLEAERLELLKMVENVERKLRGDDEGTI